MAWGILNLARIFIFKNFKTFVVVILARASTFIHLVKLSTAMIRNLSLLEAWGKGPKMFMPHRKNKHGDVNMCNSDGGVLWMFHAVDTDHISSHYHWRLGPWKNINIRTYGLSLIVLGHLSVVRLLLCVLRRGRKLTILLQDISIRESAGLSHRMFIGSLSMNCPYFLRG